MKSVSIHQPHYHYWLGLLQKIASSDLHVVLDDVQYRKRNFQNRVRISSASGEKLVSIPVLNKGYQGSNLLIKDTQLAEPQHIYKHFLALKHNYGRCKGWPFVSQELESLYQEKYLNLVDLNLATLKFAMKLFDIHTPLVLASELNAEGMKSERILNLCKMSGATHYICGSGAQSYMEEEEFNASKIKIIHQNFNHPKYKQFGTDWVPGCMALDWYFHDPDAAVDYFLQSTEQ